MGAYQARVIFGFPPGGTVMCTRKGDNRKQRRNWKVIVMIFKHTLIKMANRLRNNANATKVGNVINNRIMKIIFSNICIRVCKKRTVAIEIKRARQNKTARRNTILNKFDFVSGNRFAAHQSYINAINHQGRHV